MAEQQKNILIVEDDLELCELLAQAVRELSHSYNVKTARNVDEAMIHVRKFQTTQKTFSLAITDVKMAGLNGLELLQVLNSISPKTKTIVMTAYNSAELAERAHELNVYAYLIKPFVISEFRRIVQNALATEEPSTTELPPLLSGAQQQAIHKQLASLRLMTGANASMLIHASGDVLVVDSLESNLKLGDLGKALVSAQQQVSQQISQILQTQTAIRQSYFGTETYSTCTYRIDETFFVAVIFGPAVKEGQVWYYMRDAVSGLTEALEAKKAEPAVQTPRPSNELINMLDQYFPAETQRQKGKRPSASPLAEPSTPPQAAAPASAQRPVSRKSAKEEPSPFIAEKPIALDEINWDIPTGTDWETTVAETRQGFQGLTLEEAQQQGLVQQETARSSAGTTEAPPEPTPLTQGRSVDEIDWNVTTEVDWDTLTAETDQGFGGMSMEEAQRRGLVDNLSKK